MAKHSFDAVIFDLDGVITKTALAHSNAWKTMFDDYLKIREVKYDEPFIAFDHTNDYLPYVDGKPRYKGVESFLLSRNIHLPYGAPEDSADMDTVCGLGNKKDKTFNEVLKKEGVEVFESSVSLIRELKSEGIRIGVASSSKNCEAVLEAAGITGLFETRVDGIVSATLGLKGKPEPDIFTRACDNLGVKYDRAVVVEDAVSGVQAGRKGNFGLVLGIAREGNAKELRLQGADIVVQDLSEISLAGFEKWFTKGLEEDCWILQYTDYEPSRERTREALLAVGNGYFGTRGAMEENDANAVNYPGTYIAGIYNRLTSVVGDRKVDNEDFVNCPNWLPIGFRIEQEDWFDINHTEIIDIQRILDLRSGILTRKILVSDNKQRITYIESDRIASMDNPHLAAIRYSVTPVNYSAKMTFCSGLNGALINDGVERYRQLNQKHLKPVSEDYDQNLTSLLVQTTESGIRIAQVARIQVYSADKQLFPSFLNEINPGNIFQYFTAEVTSGNPMIIEKTVSLFTSKDEGVRNPFLEAKELAFHAGNFEEISLGSGRRWSEIWKEIDIQVEGDRLAQKLLRLHMYHLMVSASPNNAGLDASFTARGLHGEAYRGHIFWDELFIIPFYNFHFPETAKASLLYRYRRLDEARKYAKINGYKGAMFPWQSGSDGREETQVVHLNPLTGHWGDDYSCLQRHVSLAVAYNIWQYFSATRDLEFLAKYGAEMFLEICRFWASKSVKDTITGRYHISKVMGPDEFHEQYPGATEGGLRDNAYTNIMTAWILKKSQNVLSQLNENARNQVIKKTGLTTQELEKWNDITGKLNLVISEEGILSQYDGYFDLKELDWESYKNKYGNIYRLDRILKSEGKSPDEYKVAKQADTLMTFYNLDEEEVSDILSRLGYSVPEDFIQKNLKYYLNRTSHGSTLSRVVHAYLANLTGDKKLSWELYLDALTSDYSDIQGGTTGEGIHSGVMAGTVWIAMTSYAGLSLYSDKVKINPNLPDHWRKLKFSFRFRGVLYHLEITKNLIKIRIQSEPGSEVTVSVNGKDYQLKNNKLHSFGA